MKDSPERARQLVLPRRVRRGDTVAIVAPCETEVFWPEHRGERGIAYLESLGLRTKVMPHAGAKMDGKAVSPEDRAADINAAFADPEVAVVLCSIGGSESIDVVPHLDFASMRSGRKIFQGLSDATSLHWAIRKHARLVTLHGPALLPELAEYPRVLEYTDTYLRACWFGDEAVSFRPANEWTDEFLDWTEKSDLARPRHLSPSQGWRWLRPGRATGPLVGGCLETMYLNLLKGDLLDFDGAIAFIETSELQPSPPEVRKFLSEMAASGVLDGARALVFGRPYGYTEDLKSELWQVVTEVTAELDGGPVLADVDCGHTDPMLTLPFGVDATVDSEAEVFRMEGVGTELVRGPPEAAGRQDPNAGS